MTRDSRGSPIHGPAARPAMTRIPASARACVLGSRPDATGRNLLTGCRLSRSASATSLMKYTAADAAVNAAAATSAYPGPSSRPSEAPASGAANTRRFFGHCRGRAVSTTAASQRTGSR